MSVYFVKTSKSRRMDACGVASMMPVFNAAGLRLMMRHTWGDVEYGPHDSEETKYGIEAMEYVLGITPEEAKHVFDFQSYVINNNEVDSITRDDVAARVKQLAEHYENKRAIPRRSEPKGRVLPKKAQPKRKRA